MISSEVYFFVPCIFCNLQYHQTVQKNSETSLLNLITLSRKKILFGSHSVPSEAKQTIYSFNRCYQIFWKNISIKINWFKHCYFPRSNFMYFSVHHCTTCIFPVLNISVSLRTVIVYFLYRFIFSIFIIFIFLDDKRCPVSESDSKRWVPPWTCVVVQQPASQVSLHWKQYITFHWSS